MKITESIFRGMRAALLPALALCLCTPVIAETPENHTASQTVEAVEKAHAMAPVGPSAENISFKTLDYRGFSFEVPSECSGQGSVPYVVKYPDGTFGLSIEVGDAVGSNAKRCIGYCTDLARNLHIKDVKINEVKINGMKGAVATGVLESQDVTIALLVKGGKEIRCIVMNSPERGRWADHAIRSIKKN